MEPHDDRRHRFEPKVSRQPLPLGDLAETFKRRRIAVAVDSTGHVILVRPDSVVCDARNDEARREAIASLVDEFDVDQGEGIRRRGPAKRRLDLVRVDLTRRLVGRAEEAWTLDVVHEFMKAATARGLQPEYNHVVIG